MRNITIILFMLIFLVGCTSTSGNVVADTTEPNLQQATLEIKGMTCQSCALGVEYELKQVEGVVDAKVNYQDGTGTVTYDGGKVDAETIAKASTVYPAKIIKKEDLSR